MKIVDDFPPNYLEIRQFIPEVDKYKPFFAYGEEIYNPYKQVLPADIEYHEQIHLEQQKEYTSPAVWWTKYCADKGFRQEQEVEAYAKQYLFVKKYTNSKIADLALDEMVEILSSSMYNLGISQYQAKTLIRLKAKEYAIT